MWPFAVVFVLVFIIPIVYAIYISFFEKRMVGGTVFVGVDNYLRLFGMISSGRRAAGWRCSRSCRCRSCCSCRR